MTDKPAETMLDKAAKAMWDQNRKRCAMFDVELPEWEEDRKELREDWKAFAKAALEAIREPSKAMIRVAYSHYGETGAAPEDVWQSMLTEILNEEA